MLRFRAFHSWTPFEVFVYPWFMCLLFVIAGMSSRFSLKRRTSLQFLRERAIHILLPSVAGVFLIGWIGGLITSYYMDMFGEYAALIPLPVKWLIYCFAGIGPLWFAQVLFVACLVLVLVRKLDPNDQLSEWCGRLPTWSVVPLFFVVWGSAQVLNTPVITVYRFGIYLFMFFLGHYFFSQERIQSALEKGSVWTGISTLVIGIVYTHRYYGAYYAGNDILQGFFTNFYLWVAILALLGLGKRFLGFHNAATEYMTRNNFSFYVLHNPVIVVTGHCAVSMLKLPVEWCYPVILLGMVVLLPLLTALIRRIPVLNTLLLGVLPN